MSKKKIIFVCATGIATSTAAAERVMEVCKENGINVDYEQSNVASLPSLDGTADLIVSTTSVSYDLETPVIHALPLITGVGEDEVLKEIIEILK